MAQAQASAVRHFDPSLESSQVQPLKKKKDLDNFPSYAPPAGKYAAKSNASAKTGSGEGRGEGRERAASRKKAGRIDITADVLSLGGAGASTGSDRRLYGEENWWLVNDGNASLSGTSKHRVRPLHRPVF